MLEKTLESALDDHFAIVPKDLFEEAQEKAFEELDYEECTEEQCIMMIKEILQVENAFQLVLMEEDGDTQISLTWNDLDQKRVEVDFCEGCKTKQLIRSINDLVLKFIEGKKDNIVEEKTPNRVEPVVVDIPKAIVSKNKIIKTNIIKTDKLKFDDNKKSNNQILFRRKHNQYWGWFSEGNEKNDRKYVGQVKNGLPNGMGILTNPFGYKYEGEWKKGKYHGQGQETLFDGRRKIGEFKDGMLWNIKIYDKKGNLVQRWLNGEKSLIDQTLNQKVEKDDSKEKDTRFGFLFWRRVGFGEWKWYVDKSISNNDDMGVTFLGTYQGNILNDVPHGKGAYTMLDGRFYDGDFLKGREDGFGKYVFKNGDEYVGEWKEGKRNGMGKLTWLDGTLIEGLFRNNEPWDCLHYNSNLELLGNWVNGEFVSKN